MRTRIQSAAVIGSGVMGGGIAALLAGAGIRTLMLDMAPADLPAEVQDDPTAKNRIVKAGLAAALAAQPPLFMTPGDAQRITLGNLTDDLARLSTCDWIIEVVVEDPAVKRDLFRRIAQLRKPGSIVSTNTSGIPLKHLTAGLPDDFRRHFLGTHFFNPARYMKLLEVIAGEETLPEISTFLAEFGERTLGKGIVWAKDTPNFIANRIGVHGILTVMQQLEASGLTIPAVDALFGPPLGRPKTGMFKTVDLVGLDTLGHVARNTAALVADETEKALFHLPEFARRMIANRALGKKTGGGFYKTVTGDDQKKIRQVINPATQEYAPYAPPEFPCLAAARQAASLPEKLRAIVYGTDPAAAFAWRVVAAGLIYAAECIPEIAESPADIDNAMKWGYNFELGPFETWDAIGLARAAARMQTEGLQVPAKVQKMLDAGHTYFYKHEKGEAYVYDFDAKNYRPLKVSDRVLSLTTLRERDRSVHSCESATLLDLGDGVFCCEFHTKMNVLNREVVEFMQAALEHVDTQGIGLVIGNQGGGIPGAFSAGGDLGYMADLAQKGRWVDMESFLQIAQQTIQKARYAGFPVVAAPYGLTLGGGCEVCLAADRIVAHSELYMGLVEIGVGLLPAGGGCLNLWKKFIDALPEAYVDFDLAKVFLPVFKSIAMAAVSTSAADARCRGFLGPRDRIVWNRDHLIGEAKKEALRMVDDGYAPPVQKPVRVMGQAAQGLVAAELHNLLQGKYISAYDAVLTQRIAFVLGGGDVRDDSTVAEETILTLERQAFVDLWREPQTVARVKHMLKTGKPLRN